MALATDLAMGHPVEQGLGTCIVSTRLAELAGLSKGSEWFLEDTFPELSALSAALKAEGPSQQVSKLPFDRFVCAV
jgi:hypothetical protein